MNQDKKMGWHSGRKSDSTGVVKRLGRHTVWGAMCLFVFLTTGLVSVVSCLLTFRKSNLYLVPPHGLLRLLLCQNTILEGL